MQLLERLNSPLSGAFIISWFCWNYRMVFVLFASIPVSDRFKFVDTVLYPSTADKWLRFLLYPAATATVFIIIYPLLSQLVFWYWHKEKELKLKAIRDKIENATLLTVEESRQIRVLLATKEMEYENAITRQSQEIETLKKNLSEQVILYNNLAGARKAEEEAAKSNEPPEGTLKLLEILVKQRDGSVFAHDLANMIKESPQKTNYYVDEGARLNLMTNSYDQERRQLISVTQAGRKYAVSKKLI